MSPEYSALNRYDEIASDSGSDTEYTDMIPGISSCPTNIVNEPSSFSFPLLVRRCATGSSVKFLTYASTLPPTDTPNKLCLSLFCA